MQDTSFISGETRFVCLLGNPTGHSLSPAMHNLSFGLLGIDAVYTCFDVDNAHLQSVMAAFRAMERWDGCNVTMPCKQAIIPCLDGLDRAAELIGAVNVVKKEDGRAVGYNTDGVGFVASLYAQGVQVRGARMVLLGPGGAGSAILTQAALDGAARIDVFARVGGSSYAKAQGLAECVAMSAGCSIELHVLPTPAEARSAGNSSIASGSGSGDSESLDGIEAECGAAPGLGALEELATCIQEADILVNATPIGMGEGCEDSPIDARLIKPGMVVADAIYHPRETKLICDARERGCTVVPGLGMLLHQAAAGERIWFGAEMPVDEIERRLF